jgi:hypothetical protein
MRMGSKEKSLGGAGFQRALGLRVIELSSGIPCRTPGKKCSRKRQALGKHQGEAPSKWGQRIERPEEARSKWGQRIERPEEARSRGSAAPPQ